MKRIYYPLLMALFFLTGCEVFEADEPNLPIPTFYGSPTGNAIVYPDQEIVYRWEISDSSQTVELQYVYSDDSLLYRKGHGAFEESYQGEHYTNTTRAMTRTWNNSLGQKLYVVYRARYRFTNTNQTGKWSDIQYFRVFPLSTLSVAPLEITADFAFTTQRSGNYFDGVTSSTNRINLDSLITSKGLNLAKLKFIKPKTGTATALGSNGSNLARVVIGFKETGIREFPIDGLADVYGLGVNSTLTFYPFGGIYRNLYDDLGQRKVHMLLAYILSNYLPEPVGQKHTLAVKMSVDCYFEQ